MRSVIRPPPTVLTPRRIIEAGCTSFYCGWNPHAGRRRPEHLGLRASTSGFRYYPVHEDPEGHACPWHAATTSPTCATPLQWRRRRPQAPGHPPHRLRRDDSPHRTRRHGVGDQPRRRAYCWRITASGTNRFALIAGFVDLARTSKRQSFRRSLRETGLHTLSTGTAW